MAIFTMENDALDAAQFTAFNDTTGPRIAQAIVSFVSGKQGIDTSEYDSLRQGVSIRTNRHRFNGTQAKMWAGNLNHFVLVRTIGQIRSFTEFEDSPIFEDFPKFDPVQFVQDVNYPVPITFNNGPQQQEEAIIEPFVIKFRKNDNEGRFPSRSVKGNLEDGNHFDNEDGGANRIEQFIELTPPSGPRFFLDEGQEYFGEVIQPGHLTTNFNPLALYSLTEGTIVKTISPPSTGWRDVTGANPNLVDDNLHPFRVSLRTGPFTNAHSNPQVADFGLTHLSASAGTPKLQLTKDMTVECFFLYEGAGSKILFSHNIFTASTDPANNTPYELSVDAPANTFQYTHQHTNGTSVFFNGTLSASIYKVTDWNHIAVTRTIGGSTSNIIVYLNGINIGESSLTAPTGGGNTILTVGNTDQGAGGFDGGISDLKIIDRALTTNEVEEESDRLLKPIVDRSLAVIIEGFTPFIQREISPFDETRDESIVDRIQTNNSEFISALKALKFDLDGDIRESFDKKSARAGNTVYGPNAARAGTDSIAFLGLIRGG